MDVGMDPVMVRIEGKAHEQEFLAVSLWVEGHIIHWVNQFGVYCKTWFDPLCDVLSVNLPKKE